MVNLMSYCSQWECERVNEIRTPLGESVLLLHQPVLRAWLFTEDGVLLFGMAEGMPVVLAALTVVVLVVVDLSVVVLIVVFVVIVVVVVVVFVS